MKTEDERIESHIQNIKELQFKMKVKDFLHRMLSEWEVLGDVGTYYDGIREEAQEIYKSLED